MQTDDTRKEARTIAIAVLTSALTTLATGLVSWALEEVKARRKQRGNDE